MPTPPSVEELLAEVVAVLKELRAELAALREHNRGLDLNPRKRRPPSSGVL